MCLAQGPQRSDAGEARIRGPSVSSQALYHLRVVHSTTYPLRPLPRDLVSGKANGDNSQLGRG